MFNKALQNKINNPICIKYTYNDRLYVYCLRGSPGYKNMSKRKLSRFYGMLEYNKRGFRVCIKRRKS